MSKNIFRKLKGLFARPVPKQQPITLHELKTGEEDHAKMVSEIIWRVQNDLSRLELIILKNLIENRLKTLNQQRTP